MMNRVAILVLALVACSFGLQQVDAQEATDWEADGLVSLKFPNNPVSDILAIYEELTGKVVITDSRVFDGETISLTTAKDVTPEEAIELIERALKVNEYILVENKSGKSVSVFVGRTEQSLISESVTVHDSIASLPDNESVVGYFMRLEHLDPSEAATAFSNHVTLSDFGRITPMFQPSGLLITESSSMIRQFEKIRQVVDRPTDDEPFTEFVDLEYAEASVVAQIVQATLNTRKTSTPRASSTVTQNTRLAPAPTDPGPIAQVVADDRLNRIMIVANRADYNYILGIIAKFDQPLKDAETLERQLKYVFADEIVPVLVDVLQDTGTGTSSLPGGGTVTSRQQPVASPSASTLTGRQRRDVTFRDTSATDPGGRQDQLIEPLESTAPISVLVGKTRIVADVQANAIIAMGPLESLDRITDILDRLDRKPPQVYLATVIGQLDLSDGIDFGVEYLQKLTPRGEKSAFSSGLLGNGGLLGNSGIDVRDGLVTKAVAAGTGLNVYGQITDSLDAYVHALESTSRFKVLSRPAVYAKNNKKAMITSGRRIPVPTSSLTDADNGDNVNVRTNIDFQDVVLKLEVIPLINDNKEVTLTLAQVNDTVVGEQQVAENLVPIIGTEKLNTTVTIPNRTTVVLGGLIQESKTERGNGIPIVSRIPLVGHVFKTSNNSVSRKELLVFIQPTVVEDNAELIEASYEQDVLGKVGADAYERFPDQPNQMDNSLLGCEEPLPVQAEPEAAPVADGNDDGASVEKRRRRGLSRWISFGRK